MPKIVDHDKYRNELLDKFFDLFARKGYENVTMREISAETGISTGTLYHYFPTKKSILEQIFQKASIHDVSAVLSRINPDDSLESRLKRFFDYVSQNEHYFQDIVLLTIDHYRNHGSKKTFEVIKEADKYYATKIAEGLGLDSKYGFMVAIFLNGLVYHRLVFPDSVAYEEQEKLFIQMMVNFFQR